MLENVALNDFLEGFVRARAAASIALAALLATGLAGCNFVTPQATTFAYDPSDGINETVGQVDLRNVIAFTADGTDVNVVFTGVNRSTDDVDLSVQFGSGATAVENSVTLEPGSTRVGEPDTQLVLEGVDVQLGGNIEIYFQYGTDPGKQLTVPVLDDAMSTYTDLLPSPAPTETADPTPTIDPQPGATENPGQAEEGE